MKIISRGIGTPKQNRIWIGKCKQCGSVAEAEEHELKHIYKGWLRPGETIFSWEICPVCCAGDMDSGYQGMLFEPKENE